MLRNGYSVYPSFEEDVMDPELLQYSSHHGPAARYPFVSDSYTSSGAYGIPRRAPAALSAIHTPYPSSFASTARLLHPGPEPYESVDAQARYRRALAELQEAESELRVQAAVESEERRRAQEATALQAEILALRRERAREQALLAKERRQVLEIERQREARAHARMVEEARRQELEKAKRTAAAIAELRRRTVEAKQARLRAQAGIQHLLASPVRVHPTLQRPEAVLQPVSHPLVGPSHREVVQPRRTVRFVGRPTQPPQGPSGARDVDEDNVDLPELLRILGLVPQEQKSEPKQSKPVVAHVPSTNVEAKVAPAKRGVAAKRRYEADEEDADFQEIVEFFQKLMSGQEGPVDREFDKGVSADAVVTGQDKGKGKAAPAPATEATTWERQAEKLLEERLKIESDREMQDTAQAILNSLRDQGGPSATGASSSKVKVENAPKASSSRSSSIERLTQRSADTGLKPTPSASVSAPLTPTTPVTPYERISRIRTSLHSLRDSFSFPETLNFDEAGSELAFTPSNAPVRAYEHALNGLLAQLDAVDSDGDEDVRVHRRHVVLEVERELEVVDEEVIKRRPGSPAVAVASELGTKVEDGEAVGYDVEDPAEDVQAVQEEIADTSLLAPAPVEYDALSVSSRGELVDKEICDTTGNDATLVDDDSESAVGATALDEAVPVLSLPNPDDSTTRTPHDLADTAVEQAVLTTEEPSVPIDGVSSNSLDVPESPEDFAAPSSPSHAGSIVSSIPSPIPDAHVFQPSTPMSPVPALEEPGSHSYLESMTPEHFSFPPTRLSSDDDDLEDSVIIEKDDRGDSGSEHSWSEVE